MNRIEIKNFMGINSQTIVPQKVNFITGPCGTGKTSILTAIRYLLTGDGDGILIRKGADRADVKAEFSSGATISRVLAEKNVVKINNKTTTAKALNEWLETNVGCGSDAFKMTLCNAEFFKTLDAKSFTELFLRMLPVKMSIDSFLKIAKDMRGEALPKNEKSYYESLFSSYNEFGIPEIEAAYKTAFAERKEAKNVLSKLSAKAVYTGPVVPETMDELVTLLGDLKTKQAASVLYEQQLLQYNREVMARNAAEERLNTLKKRIEVYENVPENIDTVNADIRKEEDEIKLFHNSIEKHTTSAATCRANLNMLVKTVQNLSTNICPISSNLQCRTDKSGLKNEMEKLIQLNQKSIKDHEDHILRCKEQIEKREVLINTLKETVSRYNEKQSLIMEMSLIVVPQMPEKPEKPAEDFTALIKEVEGKISICNQMKIADEQRKLAEDEEEKVAMLEAAVKMLDSKKGVAPVALNKAVAVFEKICNEKSDELGKGIYLKFCADNGFKVTAKTPLTNGEYVSIDRVSSGEYVFATYLLAAIANKVYGIPYLIIDSIDKLDSMFVEEFFRLLSTDNGYTHIFIGGVNHTDTITAAKNIGVNIIRL